MRQCSCWRGCRISPGELSTPPLSSCSPFSPSPCLLWIYCWKQPTKNILLRRRLMPSELPLLPLHLLRWHFSPGAISMPSSTSSSKPLFYAKLLVGICALLIVAFESFSDFLLKHHSETYTRVSRHYAETVTMRTAK